MNRQLCPAVWSRGTTVLLSLMAVGMMAACTSAGPKQRSADDGEPPVQMAQVPDLATFRLPLDPYLTSSTNLANSTKADRLLVERCLRRFGLNYRLPPPRPSAVIGAQRRYGLADQAAAPARGYHIAPTTPRPAPAQPPANVQTVLSGRGQNRVAGRPVPEGGCVGEARRRLAAGTPAVPDEELATWLAREAFERTGRDSRVRRVYAQWSACMARAGHRYADPFKANDDPEFSAATPTLRERTVATADVRCKKETGLVNILASVETAYQQRSLTRHANALAAVKTNIEQRERNALAVLAASR